MTSPSGLLVSGQKYSFIKRCEQIEMTEYETASLTASVLSNFLTSLTVFLSIVSAYVISAFSGGKRLTRTQLCIINPCFLVAVGILGFMVISLYRRFYALGQSIEVKRGWIAAFDFSVPLSTLLIAIVLGCLVFMWSIRREDDD
jgi:hypothetical protein